MSKEMTPKEKLEQIRTYILWCNSNIDIPSGIKKNIEIINQALDRLELLEKIFSDSHICEIEARFSEIECSADKCDNCPLGIGDGICLKNTFEKKWELQKENQALRDKLNINFEEDADELCEALTQRDKLYDENLELKKEIENKDKAFEILNNLCESQTKVIGKYEKVIDILKKKKVDLVILLSSNDFKEYNANITIRINGVTYLKGNNYTLTQQEYELIKEFLESE